MVNLNHLRSFYTCALHKNVTRAAQSLDVSQPSLSQQIKAFEDEIGFELFYRNGRLLDLTPKGRELFFKAEPIFGFVTSVVDYIENKTEVQRAISIGVTDQIERPFVAKLISQLTTESIFKNSKFSVISENFDNLRSQFTKNNFNILLSHEKIENTSPIEVFEFPVKLISKKPKHTTSSIKQNNLSALLKGLGQKLVLPSKGLKLRSEIEEYIGKSNINQEVIFESNILACLTESIRNGIGCGFLPISYVFDDIKKNKLTIFGPQNGFWQHKVYMYAPKNYDPVITAEFIKVIRNFSIHEGE